MIVSRWAISVFLLYIVCSCCARDANDEYGRDSVVRPELSRQGLIADQHLRMMSNMIIQYVISKGCDYVMAFVKGHYYRYDHNHDELHRNDGTQNTCDWKPWMEKKCSSYHVPMELCCALMHCGASRSMIALGAPKDMIDTCNMTDAVLDVHGHRKRTSSKRHGDPPSISTMCIHLQSVTVFGKRESLLNMTGMHHVSNFTRLPQNVHLTGDIFSTANIRNASAKSDSILNVMNNTQPRLIQRWCKLFSRHVNKKYHLNEFKFIRRSAYWLVDIYKSAQHHHVPNNYTHGLVGCGMNYAMMAFNVEKWQTVLYKLVPK